MDYKAERKQLQLTQRQMSHKAGISLSRYKAIEECNIEGNIYERTSIERTIEREKLRALDRIERWNKLVKGEQS